MVLKTYFFNFVSVIKDYSSGPCWSYKKLAKNVQNGTIDRLKITMFLAPGPPGKNVFRGPWGELEGKGAEHVFCAVKKNPNKKSCFATAATCKCINY